MAGKGFTDGCSIVFPVLHLHWFYAGRDFYGRVPDYMDSPWSYAVFYIAFGL
jgi:hypothetical protein